jgi:4-alpha-glucanotransferase
MDDLTAEARRWGVEPGYHDVFGHWHAASEEVQRRLIAALSRGLARPPETPLVGEPIRAFQGDGRRYWALAVQLYAVRSRRNWGHGDFTDLSRLIELAAARGAAGIGLNPLHALFPDRAQEASPYAPSSRLFLNPLYIDLDAVPEFPGAAAAGIDLDTARSGDLIDYEEVARAKLDGLRLAYEHFATSGSKERRTDFNRFRREWGETLLKFSCFETLRARFAPKPWRQWQRPWRHPAPSRLKILRRDEQDQCEFHEFVQWIADRQLRACKETARRCGMPVGLYVDLAVGIHPDGAEAWGQQHAMLADVSMGAPPDEFNRAGQDWGLAPFSPSALVVHEFAPLRNLMRATMRHAGAIRLDHVLGLKRVYMVPHGCGASEGTYVNFPFEPSLQVIARASDELRCVVIGEDLGTVPEGFRETMARWGLWAYRVMLFEREHDGRFKPPEAYPEQALATFNTHDLPSLRGWLAGHDLGVKRGLGLDPGESEEARASSQQRLREILRERAGQYLDGDQGGAGSPPSRGRTGEGDAQGQPPVIPAQGEAQGQPPFIPAQAGIQSPNELFAIAAFLAQTPSRLVVIALDDVLGALEQINVPGTVDQHPNWRRKVPVTLEDLEGNDSLRRLGEVFAQQGRGFR